MSATPPFFYRGKFLPWCAQDATTAEIDLMLTDFAYPEVDPAHWYYAPPIIRGLTLEQVVSLYWMKQRSTFDIQLPGYSASGGEYGSVPDPIVVPMVLNGPPSAAHRACGYRETADGLPAWLHGMGESAEFTVDYNNDGGYQETLSFEIGLGFGSGLRDPFAYYPFTEVFPDVDDPSQWLGPFIHETDNDTYALVLRGVMFVSGSVNGEPLGAPDIFYPGSLFSHTYLGMSVSYEVLPLYLTILGQSIRFVGDGGPYYPPPEAINTTPVEESFTVAP